MAKNEVLTQEITQLHAGIGEHIGFELGAKMVKDYYDQTGENKFHFVGKDILMKLLNQPDCVGMDIYKGINEKGKQTYVLVGIDSEGKAILEYNLVNAVGQLSNEQGIVADRVKDGIGWLGF